jgi:hypothetical protein
MPEWNVPGYTPLRDLGSGGFGDVVLARHDASGVLVAIKYLRPDLLADPGFAAMFRSEAELLASVDDPNVVRLYEYVESPSGAAIVMELIDGASLREILAHQGRTTAEAALVVLQGSLMGLAAAHRRGIVHRDYKPENVLVNGDGVSKLTDFGLAARTGEHPIPAGTLAYVAPEQIGGAPASPASDVYAATATFYECLTGRPPPSGETANLPGQHVSQPADLDGIPAPLRPLIAAGMAQDPRRRPGDAITFVTELHTVASGAYGEHWEDHGRSHLGEAALLLAALWPSGALPATQAVTFRWISLLRHIGPIKAAIAVGAAAAVVAAGAALTAPKSHPARLPNRPVAAVHRVALHPSVLPVAYEPGYSNGNRIVSLERSPAEFQIWLSPAGGPGTLMTSLSWSRWDGTEAVGTGHFQWGIYTGSIVLSRVARTAGGVPYYSRLSTTSQGQSTSWEWSWAAREWIKQVPSQPPPQTPPTIDWMNRSYNLTCDNMVQTPTSVAIHDRTGTATGSGIDSGHQRWDVQIQQVTHGYLPSIGNVTGVLFYCSPQPSNYFLQELRIYRTSDGSEIGRIPHLEGSGAGAAGQLPPVYTPGSVAVENGQVTAEVKFYGPNDSHASGPSEAQHLTWTWDGREFTASESAPPQAAAACTPSALTNAVAAKQGNLQGWRVKWYACGSAWAIAAGMSPSIGYGVSVLREAGTGWQSRGMDGGRCLAAVPPQCGLTDPLTGLPPHDLLISLVDHAGLRITSGGDVVPPSSAG